ncbi:MAG: tandem-95 repeat protein [Chloroflexi bacterium]|nr:tandem-95 repeat protein [Chloroflexota bacterium]
MKKSIAYLFVLSIFLTSLFITHPTQVYAQGWYDLSADIDGDGLPNTVEEDGWYNTAGGPYVTDPLDADSDDDGLSDGLEKLYDTNPLSDHSPGIYVEYQQNFQTREYYPWQRFGDKYIALPTPLAPWGEDSVIVRRGTTFSVGGPADGTITISKSIGTLTTLTPVRDPCSGQWNIYVPDDGTVGIYEITMEDGSWSQSLNLYVIFQLPTHLSDDFVKAFIYDDDPDNPRDEISVHYSEWNSGPREYDHDDYDWIPEGEWIYHGYAWGFENRQYQDYIFEDHVIPTINGTDNTWDAANALGQRVDEYTCVAWPQYHSDAWCALNPMSCSGNNKNECTTVASLLSAFNRSAGIPSRPVWGDWRHSTWDHSTEVWTTPSSPSAENWYVMRGYSSYEGSGGVCASPQVAEGYNSLRTTSGWYASTYGMYAVSENWPESQVNNWWSTNEDEYRMATWQFDKNNHVGKIVKKDWWETRFVDYWGWPAEPTVTGTPPGDWPDLSGPTAMMLLPDASPSTDNHTIYTGIENNDNISNSTIQFSQVVANYGVDMDNDNRFDQLLFEIQVSVAQADDYWFRGQLAGGFSEGIGKVYLEAGRHTIELPFDGMDIYLNKVDGPYLLENLWVTDAENPGKEDFVNGLDFSQPDYQTSPYKFDDFGVAGAVLTNEYSYKSIDTDDDSYADTLIVETGLNIQKAGTYTAQGVLYAGQDEIPMQATWTGSAPQVTLQFNELRNTTGPYTLAHLFVRNTADQITDGITEPYIIDAVPELSAKLISLNPEPATPILPPSPIQPFFLIAAGGYSDAGVDTDDDGKFDQLLITVNVEVEAGEGGQAYRIEGWLVDANNSLISWAISDPQTLAVGIQSLSLAFDGRAINEHNVDGPFTLIALKALAGSTYTVLDQVGIAYTTFAYGHDAFEDAAVEPATSLFADDVENWTIKGDSFETGSLGAAWTTFSSTSEGRIQVTGDHGTALGTYALLMDNTSAGTYTLNEAIWTVDLSDVSEAFLTFSHAEWGDEQHEFNGDFTGSYNADGIAISDDGTNWHPIINAPDQEEGIWQRYTFDLATEAATAGMTLGPNFRIKFQQYDNYPLVTGPDGRGWDEILIVGQDIPGGQWTSESPWNLAENANYSYSHAWEVDVSGSQDGLLTAPSVDASEYASTTLKFATCYQIPSGSNAGYVEASPDGLDWSRVATFTDSSTHWATELVDLRDFDRASNLQFRFNADSQTELLWYIDDVQLTGWPATTASFIYSPQPVWVGADTTFIASTSLVTPPITYTWDFGDGPPIEMINTPTVTHQFSSEGDYAVQLTVENPYDGTDFSEIVSVGEPLTDVSFDYAPPVPVAGTPVDFTVTYTPTSATTPIIYTWDFGDGDIVVTTTQNVAHIYDAGGDYTVNLTTTNDFGTAVHSRFIEVKQGVSNASFSFSPIPAMENIPITFMAHVVPGTASQPITYTWDFGDGSPIVVTNATTIVHQFSSGDDYTIQLTAENPYGSAIFSKLTGIGTSVTETSFDYIPDEPEAGMLISFTALYTPSSALPPITYTWDFGDDTTIVTTTQTVAHSYGSGGPRTIALTTTNLGGMAVYTQVIEIREGISGVFFQNVPVSPQANAPVTFTAYVVPPTASEPITYTWNFDDGSPQVVTTTRVVKHSFNSPDTYSVRVVVDNDAGEPAVYISSVVVTEDVNDSPNARDDYATMDEGNTITTLNGGQTTLLYNDTDPDSADTLTVTTPPVSGPDHGSLILNGSGTFSYTHDGSETTGDSFTYQVCDDGEPQLCDTSVVSITVVPVNDPPDADDDSGETDEDTAVGISVLINDSDAEGDPFNMETVGRPSHGNANTNGTVVTYTPALNFNGSDAFTYTIGDGEGRSDTAWVTVTIHPVNDDPFATHDETETDEDTPVSINVLSSDEDVDGDPLTLDLVSQPIHGVTDYNTDTVIYTPTLNFNGWDIFTYTISDDQGGSDTAMVTVVVNPVNDAPVANDDAYSLDEGETLAESAPGILSNDTDIDGDTLTATLVSDVSYGVLALNEDGSFTYEHDSNENLSDSFTYRASDGLTDTNTVTVSFTITPVNDAPVVINIPNQTISVRNAFATINLDDHVADVDNTDAEMTWDFAGNTELQVNIVNRVVTVTAPGVEWLGSETIVFTATDPGGLSDSDSASFTVNPSNVAPVAGDIPDQTIDEGETFVAINLDDYVADVDNEDTEMTWDFGGNVELQVNIIDRVATIDTPDVDWNGSETVVFTATDPGGLSASDSAAFTVNAVNDVPTFTSIPVETATEDIPYTYNVTASDVEDGDVVSITAPLLPGWLDLTDHSDGTATLFGTPANQDVGDQPVTLQVQDTLGLTGTQTFTIVVNNVNDAPVTSDDNYNVDEAGTLVENVPGVLHNDHDDDGDTLTVTLVSSVTHGTLTLNGDGSFTYEHDDSENHSDNFTYRVNDGTVDSNVATANITINPVNDAPDAVSDAITVDEGDVATELDGGSDNLLDNDTDSEGNNLTVDTTPASGPEHGTLTLNANGTFSYTHDGSETTSDSFSYQVCDDGTPSECTTAIVNLTVNPVNDSPDAVDDDATTYDDTAVIITVLDNDTDPEFDTLTIETVSAPTTGSASIAGATIIYTPTLGLDGPDTFTYTISDGNDGSDTATVTVAIEVRQPDTFWIYLPLVVKNQ